MRPTELSGSVPRTSALAGLGFIGVFALVMIGMILTVGVM